jgi:hypothetical protein
MSSIIERLTEGCVNRDMRAETHALLSKWEKTGLLEGLTKDRQKTAMARLLENQAKELLRESSSMAAGDVEGFASVAFPIVRRVFAGLIANDLVSVQPMSLPSGLIFFLDFVYSPDLGGKASDGAKDRFGNISGSSIYGGNKVGSEITGGLGLVGNLAQDRPGPRTVGARGYAYASPKAEQSAPAAGCAIKAQWGINSGSANSNATNQKLIDYDPDINALSGSSTDYKVVVLDVDKTWFLTGSQKADFNNLGAFEISASALANTLIWSGDGGTNISHQVRRLTQLVSAEDSATSTKAVRFTFTVNADSGIVTVEGAGAGVRLAVQTPIVDTFTNAGSGRLGAVVGATEWGLEGSADIPEIDIKVDSVAVTAQTKKLKAKWTPELGQDLNAYHNLDAEVELTSILSEQIALEIDREILGDLVNGATASTYYWSRSPGLFVNRATGAEIGASSAAPDFTGTVSEWYETLAETINDVSAQIHRKTLRGGANFVVCGPEVANILEFTAGFRASVTADDDRGSIGAVKVGSLSKKFDVIVDPYFLRNVILVGRRGSSFLESGYVYAPYVPLQTTPTIFGVEDFVPRKGVMTRYAKKMVRPDLYGLVIVRGLLGEAGAIA